MVAVWMQDWVGTKKFIEGTRLLWNWQLNKQVYPKWEESRSKWEKDGVHPMIYINPFISNVTGDTEIRQNQF